ncbi:hypothetical protein SO694_00086044 [Aureococcus anophagefferens]|uniref:Tyrosinase copper-binding domain-containing protein n=1 Tax=Aureococcus anophagefferens TaxID=44056 RepID=A0ABR1G4W8_AURAN
MGGGSGDRAAARCRSVEVLVASVLLGGLALRARVVASRAAGPAAFEEAATTGDDDATLAFVVRTRGYDAVSPDVAALYGTWSHVVEPLREATFEAVNAAPTSSLSWRVATLARRDGAAAAAGGFSARTWAPFDASHEWDEVRESVLEYAGDAASLTCAAVHDRYRVTLVEVLAASKQGSSKTTEAVENVEPWMNVDAEDGRGATRSSRRRRVVSSDAVVCKYVRRELRQLSGDDREAYFAALERVHRTSSADGKRAYGAKFRSQKTFLLKHLGEDTVKGCSVFHGADAFLTGHAAFTLELEQALQAVDASVSAPYWDTSLDDDARGAAWAEGLELFAEDWFGARAGAGGPKLDYPALTTGRFAYVDVPSYAAGDAAGAAAAPPERNAFGRLTQSYNNDPATFLWRSDSVCGLPSKLRLPGCAALKGALREASVSDLRAKIETDWHGALHPTLGGAFDCASESAGASHFAALAKTAPELVQFVHQLAEVLWDVAHNTGHLKCPSSCDEAAGFAACRCACPALDAEFAAGNAALAYAFLDSIGLLSRYAGSQRGDVFVRTVDEKFCFAGEPNGACLAGRDADDFFVALARLSCAPGRVAPYMTPLAASNDPLFWVTHNSFERIWAFKRLTASRGAEANAEDLGDDDLGRRRPRRPPRRCRARRRRRGRRGLRRAWRDPTPFSNFLGETDDARYTNADLYALFDPTNARLPYVFDDMSWTHCRAASSR